MILRTILEHRFRWATATGLVLWLGWFLSIFLGPGPFDAAGEIVGGDWIQFHASGATVGGSYSARLYDFEWQHSLQERLLGSSFDGLHAFLNPPFFAWLFAPFALLPYHWGFIAWSVTGVAFLVLTLFMLTGGLRTRHVLLSLGFFPIFSSIAFGQNGLLSLALLTATWHLWSRERPVATGMCASLLLYKPQLVLGLLLLWALRPRRDGPTLLGFLGGAASLAGISFGTLPAASRRYLHLTLEGFPSLMAIEGFPIWHAHHLRAFWQLLLPGAGTAVTALWLSVSTGLVGAFAWSIRRRPDDREVLFSAAIILTLLVTPHAMIYDWAALLIPFFLLHVRLRSASRPFIFATIAVWSVTLASGSLSSLQLEWLGRGVQLSVPTLALAALLTLSPLLREQAAASRGREARRE